MIILLCLAFSQMNIYSIQFIAKPHNGEKNLWELHSSRSINRVKSRLEKIQRLVRIITGLSSEPLTEHADFENILGNCNPTWEKSFDIFDLRVYTFSINFKDKIAFIATKVRGNTIHTIGFGTAVDISMGNYQEVIRLMHILISLFEGDKSPNKEWVKDMSTGKTNPYPNNPNITEQQQRDHLYDSLKAIRSLSFTGSHPPEITIAVRPSCYKIVVTRDNWATEKLPLRKS